MHAAIVVDETLRPPRETMSVTSVPEAWPVP